MSDTLPSVDGPEWKAEKGLKIWDVKEGEGEPCKAGATVDIHYTGWLTNGKQFDSSRPTLKPTSTGPANFRLDGLVKGWQIGIPGMKPGGIRRLIIPSDLGYGPGGQPAAGIPGGASLVFEIKLFHAQ
ncbi:FKBP-type peptidyl-prolyl cis-trans isomerase [Fimbriiglobus ruber]